jgi:hypothetical protein
MSCRNCCITCIFSLHEIPDVKSEPINFTNKPYKTNMRYICTMHRPKALIRHYTMSSPRQRMVNNHDVCVQKQHFSKCCLSLDMTRSLTRGIRHFPLNINPHREVKRTRHYTAHIMCKDLEQKKLLAIHRYTAHAAPAAGSRDEYRKLWFLQGHRALLIIYILLHNSLCTSTIKWKWSGVAVTMVTKKEVTHLHGWRRRQ